ncbi:glycosyltransferase family 2 protein [Sphingobacterium corticibacter]|uniref:Glycosyl transferase family A n=1 Tax=Sphingobacterium corticibacter TaxID=2171749 RepID=A0A2T8HKB9_9SPHI|nr:glycosyltransferase [Sphingobacterium corticibacter]PVH25830.1 glycosyl transferase family A [Sphingobacterium corticibacter]
MISQPLISIITPIFNAEKTLPTCLQSLSLLAYENIQFVFVDDCSSDNGKKLVKTFLNDREEDNLSLLIQHQNNKGAAAARNTGLDHAKGEYIYYVDADDQLEPNTINDAVLLAVKTDADIVGFNWYLAFDKNKRKMTQPTFTSPTDALVKMMSGSMRWNLWLFLVKRSLYEDNQIRFIPGMNMGEDLMVMIKLFAVANTVSYLDQYLYHYRQSNNDSLTKTYSEAHMLQVSNNVNQAVIFLKEKSLTFDLEKFTAFLKLNIKLPLLISNKTSQYRRWQSWFPEVNQYAGKNKDNSWRTRLLERWALSGKFWLIKLYYYLVIRVVYGIIYK